MAKRTAPPVGFGFTLIELLVSLVVISVLFGLGYANFRRYAQRQELWRAARQIEGDLRLAQSYALAGKNAEGLCDIGSYFYGYQFRFNGLSSYIFYPVCRKTLDGTISSKEDDFHYQKELEPSDEFQITVDNEFIFLAVTGGMYSYTGSPVEIKVGRDTIIGSDKITITVNPTGEIKMTANF